MIIRADARHLPLIDNCVDCVVTSPPYFGLRDYGHAGQIGIEPTPAAFVAALVGVFAEVRRVLKSSGTVWLNIGDSYAASGKGDNPPESPFRKQGTNAGSLIDGHRAPYDGYKTKDLMGIPWRVALALQADGWYLRSDIIWSKPNPMPESITDRPTKAHEYLFLLAKSERYHYDADAIKEPYAEGSLERYSYPFGGPKSEEMTAAETSGAGSRTHPIGMREYKGQATKDYAAGGAQNPSDTKRRIMASMAKGEGRNKRTVWTVNTQPYAGSHFATMPEALVEPCIRAGCPEGGLVLDPFLGSGTVGAVAARLGRRWVGTDLSYQALAAKRTAQRGLMFSQESA